jgi:polysaccharide biosynthesis protein PslG
MGVHSYEVWNEPNQYFWWAPKPQPARYADMLKKAYNAAHAADSHVTIVAGALAMSRDNESGTTMNPRTFLAGMYAAGASGHFDALSFHPYTGTSDPRVVAYWSPMTGVGPDLAAMMAANGDAGTKIWATEFAYSTCSCATGLSEAEAASLLRIGLQTWRAQSYAGPLFHFTYRDMGTDRTSRAENFGLVRRDFTPKQGFSAMRNELTT